MKSIGTLAFSMLIVVSSWGQVWQVWERAPIPEPVSNNAVCEGFIGGNPYVYSFTGIDTTKIWSGIHLKAWRYNTVTDVWDTLPDVPDTLGKIAAAANRVGDTIYVMGGYHVLQSGNELSSNKVHRFNTQTNSWMSDGADIPVPIDDHVQSVWRDSLIFLVTGWSNSTNVPNVQIYNPYTNSWQVGNPVPNNNDYKSFGASGTIVGDELAYFGGASLGANFPAQDDFRTGTINPADPTQIAWNTSVPLPGVTRYRAVCFAGPFSGLYWIGGSKITYNYNGIAYNGSGGVEPADSTVLGNPQSLQQQLQTWGTNYAMDLRGYANTDPVNNYERYIVGGMENSQQVSNKCRQLWYTLTPGMNEAGASAVVSIYPNPTTGSLRVESSGLPLDEPVVVFNALGKAVHTVILQGQAATLQLEHLPAGLYMLRVGAVARKIVLERP